MNELFDVIETESNVEFINNDIDLRVLKGALTNSKLALEYSNGEYWKLFFGPNKELAQSINEYISDYKSPPTKRVLQDKHAKNGKLLPLINETFEALEQLDLHPEEYNFDVDRLRKKYVETKINDIKDSFTFNYDEDHAEQEDILVKLETHLQEIKRVRNPNSQIYIQKSVKDYLQEFKRGYVERANNPKASKGVLTKFSYLDFVTNGFRPSDLVIVAAETGCGKSVFLNNLAIQIWCQDNLTITDPSEFTSGHNVLYFSLEMPYADCYQRFMGKLADVPLYGLRDSTLNESEARSVSQACKFISKYGHTFEIVDIPSGPTMEDIEQRFLEARTRFNVDVVVIDYLGLLHLPGNLKTGSDWLDLSLIAEALHEFGRKYNIRVLTATQLNRLSNQKKTPEHHEIVGLHRLGRSSLIAHHATLIIQLETRPDEEIRQDLAMHIIKNRNGEKGSCLLQKNFAHGAIFDTPYVPYGIDELGSLVTNSAGGEEDISEKLAKILEL
jgi:replicative DNA helicase